MFTTIPKEARSTRWLALVLLCLAEFVLVLDVTAANVSLPSIRSDLQLPASALPWVLTSYVLAFGGLMLLGGRLADRYGRRRTLAVGLVLFTGSSLLVGVASTGAQLIVGRVLQGVGAALLSPAALSTITSLFSGRDRDRALGAWAAIGGSGFVVGLLVSGVLTAGPGWRWVFLVNVPIGLAVLAALPFTVPADSARSVREPLDLTGAVLVSGAAVALVYGLSNATIWPLVAALAVGGAFVVRERATSYPLIRVALLARRDVRTGTAIMLVATAMMLSTFFLASLYLQHQLGYGPLRTGLTFIPAALAITAGAHAGGRLVGRLGRRTVAVLAFLLAAGGTGLLAVAATGGNVWLTFVPGLVVTTLGLGPGFVVATTTALGDVAEHESGVASGVVNTAHELGGALGVAVMTAVAAGSLEVGATNVGGYARAYIVLAVAAAVTVLVALRTVPAGAPAHTVGHGHGH
jgi:EmrB/QacA subfamily drug resistance transporter